MKHRQLYSLIILVFLVFKIQLKAQEEPYAAKALKDEEIPHSKTQTLEEKFVTAAYEKMSLLETSERVGKIKRDGNNPTNKDHIRSLVFDLKDFRTGKIDDIKSSLYQEVVTPPTGEVIQSTEVVTKQISEDSVSLACKWVPGQYSSAFDPQWTVSDILQLDAVRFFDIDRFASYEVTVSLGEKIRKYHGLALFHRTGQAEILDNIAGMGGTLTRILKEKRLPLGMARIDKQNRSIRPNTLVCSDWWFFPDPPEDLRPISPGTNVSDGGGIWICVGWIDIVSSGGGGDGGGGSGCQTRSSPTTDPQQYSFDTNHHASGSHYGRTKFNTSCTQSTACVTDCNVSIADGGYADSGALDEYFYYHIGGSSQQIHSNSGGVDQNVSCEAASGYSFKRCVFDCGVSVTLNVTGSGAGASVSVSGGDLWNAGHIKGRTCKNGQ